MAELRSATGSYFVAGGRYLREGGGGQVDDEPAYSGFSHEQIRTRSENSHTDVVVSTVFDQRD